MNNVWPLTLGCLQSSDERRGNNKIIEGDEMYSNRGTQQSVMRFKKKKWLILPGALGKTSQRKWNFEISFQE